MDNLGQQVGTAGGGDKLRRYWGASTGIGLVLPLGVYAISMYVAFGWRERLPDPVAIHWGTNGPDGFGSLESSLYTTLGIALACNLLFWALALTAPAGRKMFTAMSLWLAVFIAAILLGSLWIQRDLADASQADGVGPVFAVAMLASLAAAATGFWLNPSDPPLPVNKVPAEQQPTTAHNQPSPAHFTHADSPEWSTTVGSTAGLWIGGSSVLLTILLPVLMQEPWMLIMPVLLTFILMATVYFRVTINQDGIEVRSLLGLPRTHIPLDEVVRATLTKTNAFGDFGGWGWRINKSGHTGIITDSGPSITVERTGGRGLVITLPDAASATATLTGLLNRHRESGA